MLFYMKPLIFIVFLLTASTSRHNLFTKPDLRCVISSDKKVYKIGEIPKLVVKIYNDTKENIYLIGSLDGSDVKWRFPYCYYSIDKLKSTETKQQRCRNMNTLRLEDFVLVKSGQEFNPYKSIDNYGFFIDYATTNAETFKNIGVYKITFHYSTNSQDINQFMGDKPFRSNASDSINLDDLFKKVPKVELTSNEIVIKIVK